MRKLLIVGLLFASTVQAQTFTCDDYTIYQGTGNGTYKQIDDSQAAKEMRVTIKTSEPLIVVLVDNTEIPKTEFWKDYNEYRNDTGNIKQIGNNFEMKTAVPDPTSNVFIPVKIIYHCK